jgi:MtN3 and saliva related transmembrane protein
MLLVKTEVAWVCRDVEGCGWAGFCLGSSITLVSWVMPVYVRLLGFIAAALTTFAFLPQVLRTFKTKSANDLHGGTLLAFSTGLVLWLIYGLYLHSWPIILANSVGLCLQLPLLVMKMRYAGK